MCTQLNSGQKIERTLGCHLLLEHEGMKTAYTVTPSASVTLRSLVRVRLLLHAPMMGAAVYSA